MGVGMTLSPVQHRTGLRAIPWGKTLAVALTTVSGFACGSGAPPPDNDAPPPLRIYVRGFDERVLGPLGANPWFLVFLGLTAGTPPDHEPRLLDRWEHTADYTEWTVHVREGLVWDDGVPVTAADVRFSLDLWTNEDVLYEYPFYDSIAVLDDHALRISFREPVSATLFTYSWLAIVPKHLLDTLSIDDLFSWPFWVEPVGNGPYRYVRHIPNTMTELTANPAYYGPPPRSPRVILRYGGNPVTELMGDNVDVVSSVTPLDAVRLASDARFRVYHAVRYQQSTAIAWNHRLALFRDAAVRRALTMAIDRRELHRVLNFPDEVPIFDVPTLGRHHRQGIVPPPLPFRPDTAARILADAGWVDADGDGVLERDGTAFRFTLSVTDDESAHAIFVQDQLRRVGIQVDIRSLDRQLLRQRVMRDADFQATIIPFNYIEQFGRFPVTGYRNPVMSALRDSAWHSIDHERSDQHLREFWVHFAEELPVTYLHPQVRYLAAHRRVQGLTNDFDLFANVEKLSISP